LSWSASLMGSLDQRSRVLETALGPVQLAREGEGPPVLVLHGGPGGFDQGLAWSRHLRDGGCEVVAVSRPGYLRTPLQSGATPADQADLCSAVLDVLDIGRVAVLGFSSGGASAVHFAARHPERATALFLDSAILLPYRPPISALQRATFESTPLIWLSYQLVTRGPRLMLPLMVEGLATGLSKEQKKAAATWIAADAARLQSLQEQSASVAPKRYRQPGWINDQRNERDLVALPFDDVAVPTLIAHGGNDAVVPLEHATNAMNKISGAELVVVDEGHHLLSLSRHYGPVADRQLELARS
jgi:pimeloyl-ACP methyl ester carboxylesterase